MWSLLCFSPGAGILFLISHIFLWENIFRTSCRVSGFEAPRGASDRKENVTRFLRNDQSGCGLHRCHLNRRGASAKSFLEARRRETRLSPWGRRRINPDTQKMSWHCNVKKGNKLKTKSKDDSNMERERKNVVLKAKEESGRVWAEPAGLWAWL